MLTELTHADLQKLKADVESSIEEYSQKLYPLEHRNHLGISEIGEPCSRKTFYKFRWFDLEYFNGRMRRLFARGHREEERYISYLENTGWKVYRLDENGKQFRVSGVLGHYGGSCDGVAYSPWYPDLPFILEFKTHNEKSFDKYLKDGLVKSKPKHYDQMSGYGYKMGINYGLYFPENKNNDDIKVTPIKLDWQRGYQLELKAQDIILAKTPPTKISENPAFMECKFCAYSDHCHRGKVPAKNCRSCRNSEPVADGQWRCNQVGDIIPSEFIAVGCDKWMPI